MALIILEGLDRTGKSSVAQLYQNKGFELIHMSAPPKDQTDDAFLEEMIEVVSLAAHKDIILDRSYYGEACVWPLIYGRNPKIDDEGLSALSEIEESVGTTRILMIDPNSEAHWQRCIDNKEPMTKPQFVRARSLFSVMADAHGFIRKTLKDFPDAVQPLPVAKSTTGTTAQTPTAPSAQETRPAESTLTKEQLKLERANCINEILAKRIIKGKTPMHDDLERNVRHFLNGELGKIFGNQQPSPAGFSPEEVELLKFFVQRLKNKEGST